MLLISPDTQKFILQFFAVTNPVYYLSRWLDPHFRESAFESDFSKFLNDPAFAPPLYGEKTEVKAMFASLPSRQDYSICPQVNPVTHVFPAYAPDLDVGLMVPMEIVQSEDWHISDAFGRFGLDLDPTGKLTPPQIFSELLKILERIWRELHPGLFLPLRWRKAFSLKLLCPVHIEAIDGDSLQVPLVVALLRAVGQMPSSPVSGPVLPFGNVPVFATGKLEGNTFGPYEDLEKKLKGFIREYGKGRPAILTSIQLEELEKSHDGCQLLDQIGQDQIHRANNLQELIRLPEINKGLLTFCGAPLITEIDGLLSSMSQLQRGVRFDEVSDLAGWLSPHIQSPVYRFKLVRQPGMIYAHRGQFIQAHAKLKELAEIVDQHPQLFGITEKIQLATAWGVVAFDAFDASMAEPFLQKVEPVLSCASLADRARYWGTRCQLFRLENHLDEAVAAGFHSLAAADQALASEGGRNRNYLIHALLKRAQRQPATSDSDLKEATTLLHQSQREWAPLGEDWPRQSHLGFCLHYEAEIVRLRRQPFRPPQKPPWSGHWGHTWLFTLLSAARNTRNDPLARLKWAEELVRVSEIWAKKGENSVDNLFALFHAVYRVYQAHLRGDDLSHPLSMAKEWCNGVKERGFSGWHQRLGPIIEKINKWGVENVEELYDAIPYH